MVKGMNYRQISFNYDEIGKRKNYTKD